jgi:tetratricopeptide (TPR) repeat protein
MRLTMKAGKSSEVAVVLPSFSTWISRSARDRIAQPEGQVLERLALAACCGFLSFGLAISAVADAQQDYASCHVALERKDWNLALDYCNRAIQSGQLAGADLSIALTTRCRLQAELQKPDEAIADCTQALRLDPNNAYAAYAYNNRGFAYWNKGQHDRAIQDYDQALHLDPNYAAAYNNRGNAYEDKGQYDRAIQDFDQALSLDPNYAAAYSNRGVAYWGKGQYDRAVQDLGQAVRLDPGNFDFRSLLGITYFYLARFDAAVKHLAQAVAQTPDSNHAVLWLSVARQRAGDSGAHELDVEAAKLDLRKWPGPIISHFQGHLSKTELLQSAEHADPDMRDKQICEYHFFVGEAALVAKRPDVARGHFERAAAGCPRNVIEYFGALAELKRMGQ